MLPKRSSIWTCHLAQSVIIGANGEDLLEDMSIESLFDIIESQSDNCSNTAYTKSLSILQCISKHLSLVKKSGIDGKLKLDHGNLLKKYENYALTNLNFGIDRVRYNVKGVFDKVIELYNVMKLDKNLHQLIQTVLAMSWESKSKSRALTSIAKENMKLLLELSPSLPQKVSELVLDPTIESIAADLYENLMKRAYDNQDSDNWIQTWIMPILEIIDEESITIMRLLKTSLKLNRDKVIGTLVLSSEDKPNLSLVCLRLDRLNGGEQWRKHMDDVIVPALTHFEDCIRILALDLLISSKR